MPGFLTTYARRKILRHRCGVELYVPPATLYVALTTEILTRNDAIIPSGVEVVGAGYAPQAVPSDATAWSNETEDPSTGILTVSNLIDITYPQATANYVEAFGWALKEGPDPDDFVWEAGAWEGTPIQPLAGEIPTILAGQLLRRSLP